MKVFTADYYKSFGIGAYQEYQYVVVANTKREAMGLLLDAEPNTSSYGWRLEEVDTGEVGATCISERSS